MAHVAPETAKRIVTGIRASGILATILLAAGILLTAFYAPLLPDCDTTPTPNCQTSPVGHKIFYVHVPVAFAAYLALTLLAYSSFRSLVREDDAWDAFAVGCAEVGVLFAGLTLFTGSLWGHLEWGFGYWNNDDTKLVLTLLLFVVYVAYLVLRRQIDDPRRRARIAAVYAILGFATVPLSYVAQRLWASIHPTVFNPPGGQGGIGTPAVEHTFIVNAAAFIVLTVFLVLLRFHNELQTRDREVSAQ